MAVVPAPPAVQPGVYSSSAQSQMVAVEAYLLATPIAELTQSAGATQTLTTGVGAPINFDTETVDSAGGHSTTSNTSRYTAVYAGWYRCSGGVGFAANASGVRACWWAVNGTSISNSSSAIQASAANILTVSARTKLIFLNVGDYVELYGFQSSGGNLATTTNAVDLCSMSIQWVSN